MRDGQERTPNIRASVFLLSSTLVLPERDASGGVAFWTIGSASRDRGSPVKTIAIASAGAAAVLAVTLLATTAADARRGGGGFSRGGHSVGRSMARAPRMAHRAPAMRRAPVHSANRMRHPSVGKVQHKGQRKQVASGKKNLAQQKRNVAKHSSPKKQIAAGKTKAGGALGFAAPAAGIAAARNLPMNKAVAGTSLTRGRVAVPANLRPRLTLTHAPAALLRPRFAPFIQRHWRRSFFWAAVAGVGYLTIPQLYYDRFYGCVNGDAPDYECSVDLLSAAALEEDNAIARVRYPMPPDAAYRYSAKIAPKPESACSFDPFVERKWNHAFVWVQIPGVGNVTVPEDYYDRFYANVAQEPPNYASACKLLVEALAADTAAAAGGT
jgi:hypothetical protein